MNMGKIGLKIVGFGLAAALAASAANAVTFDFKSNTTVGSKQYVEAKSKFSLSAATNYLSFTDTTGSPLTLKVFGGHINDTLSSSNKALNSVTTATVDDWRSYGLGVKYDRDSTSDGTHQIDNGGAGTDFVALVFDQAVTMSSFNVAAYAMSGNSYIDYDLSYMAFAGTLADLANGVNLANFTTVNAAGKTYSSANSAAGNVLTSKITTTGDFSSKIWLVSAAIVSPDKNMSMDGFKLTSLSVTAVPASVPEPATWAMMLVGFGAIGRTLRSRRGRPTMNAAIGG